MQRRMDGHRRRKRTGTLTIALLAAVAALAAPPAANAGPLVASAEGCTAAPLEQPFLPWLDPNYYVLVPNGGFESGASKWSLTGADVVQGNEPYYVHGAGESKSLSIASGGSATSDVMCVGVEEPTLRLFVRSSSASLTSKLKVEVIYEDGSGGVHSLPIGYAPALTSTAWAPSAPMVIGVNLLPLLDGKTPVKFRFTAQGAASWQIDDVYVDPRYR